MPKISVIVPVYGVEKYIERCARSLFEQTLDDIEYLFIDDCTPDRSIDILKRVLEEYPNRKSQVIIHRMTQNSGQAAVRKWGMMNATGEYVIHCDSDDWVDTDMYRAMYEKAKNEDADVVVCDYCVHDGEKCVKIYKGSRTNDKKKFITQMLFQKIHWALWNKLVKRSVCCNNLIFPKGNMGEDLALISQMLLKSSKIAYLEKIYYFYFINKDSITKKITIDKLLRNFYSTIENAEIVVNTYKEYDWEQKRACLLYTEYNAVSILFPLFHIKKYRRLYQSTYPQLYKRIVTEIHFPLRHKLIFLAACIGLYPHKIRE